MRYILAAVLLSAAIAAADETQVVVGTTSTIVAPADSHRMSLCVGEVSTISGNVFCGHTNPATTTNSLELNTGYCWQTGASPQQALYCIGTVSTDRVWVEKVSR